MSSASSERDKQMLFLAKTAPMNVRRALYIEFGSPRIRQQWLDTWVDDEGGLHYGKRPENEVP